MDKSDFVGVKYKASSNNKSRAGDTTPNDEFWDYSAAAKSVFMFDDEDEDSSWSIQENHFSKQLMETSIGTKNSSKNSANTSETSSFESIQRFDEHLAVQDHRHSTSSAASKKVTHSTNIEPVPVNVAINSILRGEPFLLEPYKSKELKIALLDAATACNDGNAINIAILHLKKTIKPSIFHQEIRLRPVAISHYVNYLRNHYDFNELYDFFLTLGRTEDAAMLKLKMACSQKNVEQKIIHLENCYKFHFKNDAKLSFYSDMIHNQIILLQKQLAISKYDEQLQNQSAATAQQKQQQPQPKKLLPTLVGMPVITSLYYCTLYHYAEPENSYSSPLSLKKSYQLSEKQYTWTVIGALAKNKSWHDIQAFLTVKGIFGGAKLKSCIGFDKVAEILHKAGAPPDIVVKYLKLIDSIEDRLNVSKRLQCHTLVIDTYVLMKDSQGLLGYKSQLKQGTHEYSYIENALRASVPQQQQ